MATIKYKDKDGQWKKISIGGTGGGIVEEKEVYIGDSPTDEAKIWINPTGTPSGGSITLDTEMSDTSTNAVQNKVIKAYVDEKIKNSGGGGGVSEDGTLLLPIYAAELQGDVPLTSEEIEANKIAYRAAREGVKALYYIHSVQLGDIKFLMSGTVVSTDVVIFVSSLGVAISSDQNSDICDATMYTVMIASDGQSQGIDLSRNLATKEYVDEMANNAEAAAKQYTDEKIGNPDRLQLKFQRVQNEHTLAMTDSSSMWLEGSMEDAVLYLPEDDAFDGWMLNVFAYPVISKMDGQPYVRGRILCPHKTEAGSIYHASQIYLPNGGHLQLTYNIVKHEWVLLNDQSNGAEYTRYES